MRSRSIPQSMTDLEPLRSIILTSGDASRTETDQRTSYSVDPPYLDAEEYRLGVFTLQDHMDLADILRHAKSKWLLTIGDHPKIRKLYNGFQTERVRTHLSVPKIIRDKRPTFKQLIIRNYEPPKDATLHSRCGSNAC